MTSFRGTSRKRKIWSHFIVWFVMHTSFIMHYMSMRIFSMALAGILDHMYGAHYYVICVCVFMCGTINSFLLHLTDDRDMHGLFSRGYKTYTSPLFIISLNFGYELRSTGLLKNCFWIILYQCLLSKCNGMPVHSLGFK